MTEQFLGFMVTTTTELQIHTQTYAHHKMGEVIESIIEKDHFKEAQIQSIHVEPRWREEKKSTPASGTYSKEVVNPDGSYTVVTEQGIRITLQPDGSVTGCPMSPIQVNGGPSCRTLM